MSNIFIVCVSLSLSLSLIINTIQEGLWTQDKGLKTAVLLNFQWCKLFVVDKATETTGSSETFELLGDEAVP